MESDHPTAAGAARAESATRYNFTRNDPFDRNAPIEMVVEQLLTSREFMSTIRTFPVLPGTIATWFLGQNGFIIKNDAGCVFGIDLYLTNSCATIFADEPFRLDRQLPVFIQPEDLDLDVFITTHSHTDHADPETIRRTDKARIGRFVGPWNSIAVYTENGVPADRISLIHPGETIDWPDGTKIGATFALPTDDTDLNHTGVLLEFANGIRFLNSGDTAYAPRLHALLPSDVDICTICINGGFHNLSAVDAAEIVKEIRPRVAVPCHYDMMVNNVGDPGMFRAALALVGSDATFRQLSYYEPWVYDRADYPRAAAA
jgi:L-ascorbate 6-phosphate lactonase